MHQNGKQPIHDLLLPFFPEWTGLRHVSGMDHAGELTRMHVELLHVLARKEKLDLFEVASLLNIGHISAAEMVDTLIEKGLVHTSASGSSQVRIGISDKVKAHIRPTSGFASTKDIVHRGRDSKYSLFSEKALRGKKK